MVKGPMLVGKAREVAMSAARVRSLGLGLREATLEKKMA